MPDENKPGEPVEGQTENTAISELQADFQKKLDELEARYKNELSSRDKVITKISGELKEKEQAIQAKEQEGLTELEKVRLEVQREKEARQNFERMATLEKNRNIAVAKLTEVGLSTDFLDFVDISTEENIIASTSKLAMIDSKRKQLYAEEFARSNGGKNPTPQGTPPAKTWREMTIGERTALWNQNQELAQQMMDKETPKH